MSMHFFFTGARALEDGIWIVDAPIADLAGSFKPLNRQGEVSVLLVGQPRFESEVGRLEMSPAHTTLLNLGTSTKTLVIRMTTSVAAIEVARMNGRSQMKTVNRLSIGSGDQSFLDNLDQQPGDLAELGRRLLNGVRQLSPGDLREVGSRFIDSPDGFWTVKIQPRARDLVVTVRGYPSHFGKTKVIDLKADRGSYSRFKVNHLEQIDEAVNIILTAKRKQ